jgi:hypothetical protein
MEGRQRLMGLTKGKRADQNAREALEEWLSEHISRRNAIEPSVGRDISAQLRQYSTGERLTLVRQLLDDRPVLNQAVGRLSLDEQLNLTLQLLHGTATPRESTPSLVLRPPLGSELRRVRVNLSEHPELCVARFRGRDWPRRSH